jgi:tetratricopeptide (TPR) repeat protein
MNKMLVTLVLALMTTAVSAQGTGQSQSQQPANSQTQSGAASQAQPSNAGQSQPGSGQSQSGNKEIKDPNEYNAYISALNTTDPAQKAAAMEAFIKQYPQSVVKLDAQEGAMAAYQGANNPAKVKEMALAILQDNPNHIRARAIVTAFDRAAATNGDTTALKDGCDAAQKGLQGLSSWTKPEGMADAEYDKAKTEMTEILNGTAGFCALQNKDYATAKTYYQKAIEVDPKNLQDTFQLAVADLESNPIDLNGFWYAAKAINLAGSNAQTVKGINDYAKPRYKNYTGNYDGWDQLVANAATQTAPPADLQASIKAKPTPCEVAVDAVNKNDPATLSFSDWEFILSHATCSPANKQAADKVWQAIQSKEKSGEADVKLKLPQVLVISATKNEIQAAITDDNQQAKKADLKVNLEKPVLHPPAAGSTIDVVGVISSYTPEPFMFTMDKGDVPGAKPAPRKTVHHAQTARRRKAS